MAHALTGLRLVLVAPVAFGLARPGAMPSLLLLTLVLVAIATDYLDGKVARATGTESLSGQLFDHTTDFLFVTSGLAGGAIAGQLSAALPPLIAVAYAQYVIDSFWLHRQKRLRMSALGRMNGILYFVPLVVIAGSRVGALAEIPMSWTTLTTWMGYALLVSTVVSIVDRAVAPLRMARVPAPRPGARARLGPEEP